MIPAIALRDGIDSTSQFETTTTTTTVAPFPPEISKEQVVAKIADIYPPSSNKLQHTVFKEDLVTEDKTPVESGSSSIYWLKRSCKRPVAFNSLLKREGVIVSVDDSGFTAKLVDLEHDTVDEVAEFPIDEVSDDDKKLLKVGAVFYWNIGYRLLPTGQKERSSIIRFRRLPAWTRSELEKAQKKADELKTLFGW